MEWFPIILKFNSKAVASKAFEVRHNRECISTNFAFNLSYDEQNTLQVETGPRSHTHAMALSISRYSQSPSLHYATLSLVLPLAGFPTSRPSHILLHQLEDSSMCPIQQASLNLSLHKDSLHTIFFPSGTYHNYN